MAFWQWSKTASSNATADATINYSEGQAPSSINDSARAAMARTAEYRDDICGAIVTGGTSTAFTVTSFQGFDSYPHASGKVIAFTPHTTNGATVTLNLDGLGAKPLRSAPSVELLAGTIIQGTPYTALYNDSDGAFYLSNFYGNAYNIPLAGGMDFWGTTVPNSSFAFPIGQAISRTTYSALFAIMSTTYGSGDGSTTFNLPDKTGRLSAMKEATATRLTTSGGGVDGATMGAVGGVQNATIAQGNLPSVTLTTTITDPGHAHTIKAGSSGGGSDHVTQGDFGASSTLPVGPTGPIAVATTGITASTALGGSGTAFKLVQPTIITNYIIRII